MQEGNSTQTLDGYMSQLGIDASKITLVFKKHKVSAVIKHNGRTYASSALTQNQAIDSALKRIPA